MDFCSKYSGYIATNPMANRVGETVLSSGPPNRIAPNVTLIAGHRHQQALRYQEQQHRLAVVNSSEGLYQQQQHSFERYHPAVSYASYHPPSYGTVGLGYSNLERRETTPYLNPHAHAQHPHHLYHPAHYDSTYNGRMIGGGGSSLPYHSYRGAYEHQGVPSSVLHYTARSGALPYGHHMPNAPSSSQQREYLSYYPHHHPFSSEQSYGQHNLHSINGLQLLTSKTDIRPKANQHITETEIPYAQQQNRQQQSLALSPASSLPSVDSTVIASPITSGSTTSDSVINGNSRCGSTPVSSVSSSGPYSAEFSQNNTTTVRNEEGNIVLKDVKDEQRSLPATPEISDENKSSLKDHQFSPQTPGTKPLASPSECEKPLNVNICASSRSECSNPTVHSPERCGTPYMASTRTQTNFQSPRRLLSTHKWSPNHCEPIDTPASFSPKSFISKPKKKRIYMPASRSNVFETKKNRVVECDLIRSKKSKKKSDVTNTDEIRQEIRDIKPLPGFQQAFGSTEIGRFFETFLNIPSSPYDSVYSCESEADTMSPQPWEIESSVDGSQFDVQISASLHSMYKPSLGDKNFFSGIRCNGY